MSTCRVSRMNSSPAPETMPAPTPAAAPPPAELEPALIFHTDYEWNSSGTRIRCAHSQCRAVFTVPEAGDVEAGEAVFAAHQREVLGSVPVELAALRRLWAAMPDMLASLAHGVPALRIEAALSRIISETEHAISGARDLIIDQPAPAAETQTEEATTEPDPEPGTAPEPEPSRGPAPADPEPVSGPKPELPAPAEDAAARPRADVTGVKAGDRVHAVFSTAKQGVFDMEATVIEGLGKDQLVVGSWLLSSDGTASAHLQEVTVIAEAGSHDKRVAPGSSAPEHFGTGI